MNFLLCFCVSVLSGDCLLHIFPRGMHLAELQTAAAEEAAHADETEDEHEAHEEEEGGHEGHDHSSGIRVATWVTAGSFCFILLELALRWYLECGGKKQEHVPLEEGGNGGDKKGGVRKRRQTAKKDAVEFEGINDEF